MIRDPTTKEILFLNVGKKPLNSMKKLERKISPFWSVQEESSSVVSASPASTSSDASCSGRKKS
jgi:hypothetical protein